MSGYGLARFKLADIFSDHDAREFFRNFWDDRGVVGGLGFSRICDPMKYTDFREWLHIKEATKQAILDLKRYKNVIFTPPSQIPLTIHEPQAVVPSSRRRELDQIHQRNLVESPILSKLSVPLLVEIMDYLGPASQLVARQVSRDFFDAFNANLTGRLHKEDEKNNAAVLRRDAREHGFRQRIANYQHKYNNTIFHGRCNSPVCLIPLSPGAKWMNHIDIMYTNTPFISVVDYSVNKLYTRLVAGSTGRGFQITLKPHANPCNRNAEDIAETDGSVIKNGYCLDCRRMRFTDCASRTLQLYGFTDRLLYRKPYPVVFGQGMPHTSCLVFEKCQSICCQCCDGQTSDIDQFEDPMENIDDLYSPENIPNSAHGRADLILQRRPNGNFCCKGTTPDIARQAEATAKYAGFYDFQGKPKCCIERAHPEIGSERHPTVNSTKYSLGNNVLWGIYCGVCETHHSRLLFDDINHPSIIRPAHPFYIYTSAGQEDRECLLSESCMNKYLGGPEGYRTASFNLPVFRHTSGTHVNYNFIANNLRGVLRSPQCTSPRSPFNKSICAHMRSGGNSLFDKLMLPFEPGVCACFDFDEAPQGSVPVSGHGEQNHSHYSRDKGTTNFRYNTQLRDLIEDVTLRHAAPEHIHEFYSRLTSIKNKYTDDEADADTILEPIDQDKCCRCLAVGDPGRQGVFSVGPYDTECMMCGTVEPIMYPHQYRCMHCVSHYSWVSDPEDPEQVLIRIERFRDSTETKERGIWGALASMDPVRIFNPRGGSNRSRDLKYVTWCDHSGDARLDGTCRNNNLEEQCSTTANWYKHTERVLVDRDETRVDTDIRREAIFDRKSAFSRFDYSVWLMQRYSRRQWNVLDHIEKVEYDHEF